MAPFDATWRVPVIENDPRRARGARTVGPPSGPLVVDEPEETEEETSEEEE